MGFFNRIAGMFGARGKVKVAALAAPSIPAPVVRSMKEYVQDLIERSSTYSPSYAQRATHRTSHRTVSMDLRDARRRRNIEKRKRR